MGQESKYSAHNRIKHLQSNMDTALNVERNHSMLEMTGHEEEISID